MKKPNLSIRKKVVIAAAAGVALSSCGGDALHGGRFPFSMMEKPPRAMAKQKVSSRGRPASFEFVTEHRGGPVPSVIKREILAGDVVTFYMTHDEALASLSKGRIQKVPYELFQYGHLALVVPDPENRGGLRLLQVAMKQAVNVDEGLDYLDGKRWRLFRPPSGAVNPSRLKGFAATVIERANDPKTAYDYAGVLGWRNAPWQPVDRDEIGETYSCATLVVAALHYSGFELDAVNRKGRFDVVTPKQVVESRGWIRSERNRSLHEGLGGF